MSAAPAEQPDTTPAPPQLHDGRTNPAPTPDPPYRATPLELDEE